MRPVKMVLRPQVCVCVIERRVAHVETRLPIFAIDIAKSGQKRPFFLKKWLNKAFQDTVGRIMSPRGWQKWVTSLLNNERTVFMGTPIRATHCPSKPKGKSVIFCSIEPWMLSAWHVIDV